MFVVLVFVCLGWGGVCVILGFGCCLLGVCGFVGFVFWVAVLLTVQCALFGFLVLLCDGWFCVNLVC